MHRSITTTVIAAVLFLSARAAAAQPAPPDDDGRCLTCHALTNLTVRQESGALRSFSVAPKTFAQSVHGRLTCRQCHADVDNRYPHRFQGSRARVSCAQECHASDANGRPYTHAAAAADFESSAHRPHASRSRAPLPTCLSCHGGGDAHAIVSPKNQPPRARMALCADCHADAVPSYKRSFHYKAIRFGGTNAAICQDCHTAHRILPASDPKSSVAAAALPSTCGQASCHRGAGANFAVSGANHLDLRVKHEPLLAAEEWLFWLLTWGTMAMLAIGIVLDVQTHFRWQSLARAALRSLRRPLELVPVAGRRTMRAAKWLLAG